MTNLTTKVPQTTSHSKTNTWASPLADHRKILVVEDDLELTAVLDGVMKSIDPTMEADWVTSTEEALSLLRNPTGAPRKNGGPYDLLLVDIFLEGSSTGLDLWKLCQQAYPEMPVVITSGLPIDKFFTTLGRDTIAPPFLAKPFQFGECKQLLQGILNYSDQRGWD